MAKISKDMGFHIRLGASILIIGLITIITLLSIRERSRVPSSQSDRGTAQEATGHPKKQRARTVPHLETEVPEVEIISATIEGDIEKTDASGAVLNFQVRNNTNRSVTYIRFVAGESGVTADGGVASDTPQEILAPHGTLTMRYPMANILEGDPLKITAVEFSDGESKGPDKSWIAIERAADKKQRERIEKERQRK